MRTPVLSFLVTAALLLPLACGGGTSNRAPGGSGGPVPTIQAVQPASVAPDADSQAPACKRFGGPRC